jgi:hypothetical protein
LDWSQVLGACNSGEITAYEVKAAALKEACTRTERRVATIINELVDLPSPALRERLRAEEAALEALKTEYQSTEKALESARAKNRDLLNSSVVYSTLAGARDFESRVKLRAEIRRKVEGIAIWFERNGPEVPKLVEDPGKDLFPFAEIFFCNRERRYVLFAPGVTVALVPPNIEISPHRPAK